MDTEVEASPVLDELEEAMAMEMEVLRYRLPLKGLHVLTPLPHEI